MSIKNDVATIKRAFALYGEPGIWFWEVVISAIDYRLSPASHQAYAKLKGTSITPEGLESTFRVVSIRLEEVQDLKGLREYAKSKL